MEFCRSLVWWTVEHGEFFSFPCFTDMRDTIVPHRHRCCFQWHHGLNINTAYINSMVALNIVSVGRSLPYAMYITVSTKSLAARRVQHQTTHSASGKGSRGRGACGGGRPRQLPVCQRHRPVTRRVQYWWVYNNNNLISCMNILQPIE